MHSTDFRVARANMVRSQLLANQVRDRRVIEAMGEVPREVFAPEGRRGVAYVDEDLPLAPGRHLMEPVVLARLLEVAAIGADDVALEVGCASGYATCVLARLCATVVALESDDALAALAESNLAQEGADNAIVVRGELTAGYAEQAPYDVIFLNGAVSAIPEALHAQLAEGGRMVAVVRPGASVGKITLFQRANGLAHRARAVRLSHADPARLRRGPPPGVLIARAGPATPGAI